MWGSSVGLEYLFNYRRMQGTDKTLGCQTDDFTVVFVFLILGGAGGEGTPLSELADLRPLLIKQERFLLIIFAADFNQ